MIIVTGYILFFFAGVLCGLFGLGGSILLIPSLVYCFDMVIYDATIYCFLIVFFSAFIGTMKHISLKTFSLSNINILYCAVSAIISTLIFRIIIVPKIPEFIHIFNFQLNKDIFLMMIFALILFLSGLSILYTKQSYHYSKNNVILVLVGLLVGPFSATFGLGGGFIIVPALILFNNMNIKLASASSILIISLNMFCILILEIAILKFSININFMLLLLSLSISGVLIGIYILNKIDIKLLQKGYAIGLLLLSLLIFYIELLH